MKAVALKGLMIHSNIFKAVPLFILVLVAVHITKNLRRQTNRESYITTYILNYNARYRTHKPFTASKILTDSLVSL